MSKKKVSDKPAAATGSDASKTARERRALLKRLGRFAAVTGPTVTLLLAAQARPGRAQGRSLCGVCQPSSSRAFKTIAGAVQPSAVLSGLAIVDKAVDPIDGVGICLAAIKALSARLDMLQAELAQSA